MSDQNRFKVVFENLRFALEEDAADQRETVKVLPFNEVTSEELEEIESLRKVILEVTEQEPVSYTTT